MATLRTTTIDCICTQLRAATVAKYSSVTDSRPPPPPPPRPQCTRTMARRRARGGPRLLAAGDRQACHYPSTTPPTPHPQLSPACKRQQTISCGPRVNKTLILSKTLAESEEDGEAVPVTWLPGGVHNSFSQLFFAGDLTLSKSLRLVISSLCNVTAM